MVKTEVQIPDDLYHKIKLIAKTREMSFAEVIRLGAEYMTSVYPVDKEISNNWELPQISTLVCEESNNPYYLRDLSREDEVNRH